MTMSQDVQDAVSLAVAGPVATLTLNRPGSYNALNPVLARGLRMQAETVEPCEEIRMMVIRGAGRGFCGGGDIQAIGTQGDGSSRFIAAMLEDVHAFLATVQRMPQVVVAAVHGVAAGAGLSFASMADLCVATDDASFVPSYLSLGVSPDCGGTVGMVRAAGVRGALDLYLLKDRLTAREAQQAGLVNVVVTAGDLDKELDRIAERICGMPQLAVSNTKRLVRQALTTPLLDQLEGEGAGLIACTQTEGFRRGLAAFLKR
jgi:enoyl-CoA hydratase/carnithine racemase